MEAVHSSPMGTADSLLRAVLEDPASDAPRRAYARWANDHGDIRGRFIELQLELAALARANATVAQWTGPHDRAKELLETYGALWLRPLEELDMIRDPVFHRGFVEEVTIDAARLAEAAPRVFNLAPVLHLTLANVRAAPDVLASPALSRIVSLALPRQDLDDAALERLAASPHAVALRWLDIAGNEITARGIDALCASPHLRALAYVNLVGNPVADPSDAAGYEGAALIHTHTTGAGEALERRFGRIAWLHAADRFGDAFPPLRLAVEPG